MTTRIATERGIISSLDGVWYVDDDGDLRFSSFDQAARYVRLMETADRWRSEAADYLPGTAAWRVRMRRAEDAESSMERLAEYEREHVDPDTILAERVRQSEVLTLVELDRPRGRITILDGNGRYWNYTFPTAEEAAEHITLALNADIS